MARDTFKITILEDGTIKTETDKVSAANHQNAAEFITAMSRLAGGTEKITRKQSRPLTQAAKVEQRH
jgi:hypothetical protein